MTSATAVARKTALTTWEHFWYVLQCIALGAGYFAKIPAKKAMADFGLTELSGTEHFWYILMCIGFGAGYFAKIPTAKALSELPQFRAQREANFGTLSEVSPADATSPSPPANLPPWGAEGAASPELTGTEQTPGTPESSGETPEPPAGEAGQN